MRQPGMQVGTALPAMQLPLHAAAAARFTHCPISPAWPWPVSAGDPEAAAAAAAGGRRGQQQTQQPPEPPYDGPIQPISKDDYFTKNAEFAAWLKESKGVFFRWGPAPAAALPLAYEACGCSLPDGFVVQSLPPLPPGCSEQSTEQNRAAFDEFVAAWNARRLPGRLYRGEVGATRTSHAWGIKGQWVGLGHGACTLAGWPVACLPVLHAHALGTVSAEGGAAPTCHFFFLKRPWGLHAMLEWVRAICRSPCSLRAGSGQALAASGVVDMAAALDEELNLKEQVRARCQQTVFQQSAAQRSRWWDCGWATCAGWPSVQQRLPGGRRQTTAAVAKASAMCCLRPIPAAGARSGAGGAAAAAARGQGVAGRGGAPPDRQVSADRLLTWAGCTLSVHGPMHPLGCRGVAG